MALPLKLEHRIGVQAPAEVIWGIIADIPGWEGWNPLYPKSEGMLRIDQVLTLELALPGEPARTIRPTIVDWVPNEQILWKQRRFGGLLRTTRYIEIETLSETGCIFSNGEIFEGFLRRYMTRRLVRAIKAGFASMGETVRDRAEAVWRETSQGATLA